MTRVPAQSLLAPLAGAFPRVGRVTWIGVRPARHAPVRVVETASAIVGRGLDGDRYGHAGSREVTLVQAEHLPVIATLLGRAAIDPAILRRNVVVAGINLVALKDRRLRLGDAVLEITGACHPCSRMEAALGEGGYNAMRGHGGVNARVVEGGAFTLASAAIALE